ncbi:MAG TPA: M56 family metallopeptidase [Anaerolineae bacterium]|nr:M56 family metallopeptidase [Anaerolineae bacterium]
MIEVAGHHLVPCLLASAAIHLGLLLVFGPLKVGSAKDRILFLYVALAKAAFALWVGSGISCLVGYPRVIGYLAIRLPNVTREEAILEPHALVVALADSALSKPVLFAGILVGVALLCYRWARLAPVYRGIREARSVGNERPKEVTALFEELVAQMRWPRWWLARPRLILVDDPSFSVATMGIRPPIVVLSSDLAVELGRDELKAALAHELGHVKRLDYVGRWFATVLRDIMIWNPLVLHWYAQLEREQERAADEQAAELLGDPIAMASALVEISAHAQNLPAVSVGPLAIRAQGSRLRELYQRIHHLERNPSRSGPRHAYARYLLWTLLVGFTAMQPHVAISFPRLLAILPGPR